jgi:hypothetical protein
MPMHNFIDNQYLLFIIVVIDLSRTCDNIVILIYNALIMLMIYSWIKIKLKVLIFSTVDRKQTEQENKRKNRQTEHYQVFPKHQVLAKILYRHSSMSEDRLLVRWIMGTGSAAVRSLPRGPVGTRSPHASDHGRVPCRRQTPPG